MDSVEFQGNAGDLDRFARDVLKYTATIDEPSRFERRMRWNMAGSAGVGSTMNLRSDIKLSTTSIRWEGPWAFAFSETPTPLKFMLGRGAAPRLTSDNGTSHAMASGVLQVRHAARPLNTTCQFLPGGGEYEQLGLEIAPERLKDLLGTSVLPAVLEQLLAGSGATETHEQPLVPAVSRFLDEFLHAESRGASRSLFLEAKALELLAVLMDELTLASDALSPLTVRDIERLQRARRLLLERMTSPPSLSALARAVALNEFKLKAGFRTLFGTSVFGYLRGQRLERARQLLLARRDLTVIEIAARVGYQNPSKFSAAFRRQFGLPPSAFR